MTDIEKLDFVLNFIKSKMTVSAHWGYGLVWTHIEKTTELKINKTLFDEIINKLKKDGYIVDNETKDACRVTFEGLIFKGYKKQEEENQELQRTVNSLSVRTFWLTVAIAVGTGVAAIYYLLEILNSLFSIYPTK